MMRYLSSRDSSYNYPFLDLFPDSQATHRNIYITMCSYSSVPPGNLGSCINSTPLTLVISRAKFINKFYFTHWITEQTMVLVIATVLF